MVTHSQARLWQFRPNSHLAPPPYAPKSSVMTNDQNPDKLAPIQPSLETSAPAIPAGVFDDLFDHTAVFDVSASPVLIVHARQAYWVQGDIAEAIDPSTIRGRLTTEIPLVLHAPSQAKRLDLPVVRAADLLELYAFVRPASFVSPTTAVLHRPLGSKRPSLTADQQKDTLQGVATFMRLAAQQLLAEAAATPDAQMIPAAWMMARAKWPWAAAVMTTLANARRSSAAMPSAPCAYGIKSIHGKMRAPRQRLEQTRSWRTRRERNWTDC